MGLSPIIWNKFGTLTTADELNTYFINREYEHTYYYHYTTLEVINSILENNAFWLSNVAGFNDRADKAQFIGAEREFYSLCFSTGINENLPLWYLYSGIDGKGGRIEIPKKQIYDLINNSTYKLYSICDKGSTKALDEPQKELINGIDMELIFKDIIYYRRNEGNYSLKYNNLTNYKLNLTQGKNFLDNRKYFLKGLIWYYEKETRLLIRLKGEAKEIAEKSGKDFVVTLSIPDIVQSDINVNFAPKVTEENKQAVLGDYSAIKKLGERAALSDYTGEIEITPCSRCPDKRAGKKNKNSGGKKYVLQKLRKRDQ